MLEIYNDTLRDLLPADADADADGDGKDAAGSPSKPGRGKDRGKGQGKGQAGSATSGSGEKLEIKLDAKGNPVAQGLSVHRAGSVGEVLALLALASSRRNVSDNGRNVASSRSHTVFTLQI